MRLRRSDWHTPGIRRRRRGSGFSYAWPDGRPVTDADILRRIRALAVPPAWTEVWICPWPHGHIQAVGFDKAGRRQYRYHDDWRALRDRQKFEHVLSFARALPALRDRVEADLALDGMPRERAVACTVRLLDLGFFRIGGEQYALEHETFGISTIKRAHVRVRDGRMTFDYPAKGSVRRVVSISDPPALAVVEALKNKRGGPGNLFSYQSGDRWAPVRSDDVNAYIRQAAGGDFSAKDFRTWSATMLAAVELAGVPAGRMTSKGARTRAVSRAVKAVSEYLGNTPAVCRASYVDPKVVDRFLGGDTIAAALQEIGEKADLTDRQVRERVELAVIDLVAEDRPGEEAA